MEMLLGKPVAERVFREIGRLMDGSDPPTLVIYLIGSDPSAAIYARSKIRKGEAVGIETKIRELPAGTTTEEVLPLLMKDGSSDDVSGIMIESPLPDGVNMERLVRAIPPRKDVEGVTFENFGRMCMGRPLFIPPTPLGALLIMRHYSIDACGKEVVVVGRGRDVGRPLSNLLSMKANWADATVTLAHSRTEDLGSVTGRADLLFSGVGRKNLIDRSMVKEGAVVIDMGMTPLPDGSGVAGDVNVPSLEGWASAVTPTPGGTGSATVSAIFLNLMIAHLRSRSRPRSFSDNAIQAIYGRSVR